MALVIKIWKVVGGLCRGISEVGLVSIEYSRWAEVSQAIFLSFIATWFMFPPPPGYAVALLGAAGIVMAVRAERFTPTEKAIWILIGAAFISLEIKAISRDRKDSESVQANIRGMDRISREVEHRQFQRLLKQGQDLFSAEQRFSNRALSEIREGIASAT